MTRSSRYDCTTSDGAHDWTSEGEGGCDQNPGVWSTGGTSFAFRAHCTVCGAVRYEVSHGSQRNPGDRDEYRITFANGDGSPWYCTTCDQEECDDRDDRGADCQHTTCEECDCAPECAWCDEVATTTDIDGDPACDHCTHSSALNGAVRS